MAIHYVATDGSGDFTTIAQVNAHTFVADDQILFRRGDIWRETLLLGQSGTDEHPIVVGAYGTGDLPKIYGSTQISTWTYHDTNIWIATSDADPNSLWIVNADGSVVWCEDMGTHGNCVALYQWAYEGTTVYLYTGGSSAEYDPDNTDLYKSVEKPTRWVGVNLSTRSYITISYLDISFCWGWDGYANEGAGISRLPSSNIAGIIIEYNNAHHIGKLSLTDSNNHQGNGFLPYNLSNGIIRYNTASYCGRRGVCIFASNNSYVCDNNLIEHNTIYNCTHAGIDLFEESGTNTSNTTIRYNLIYNTTNYGQGAPTVPGNHGILVETNSGNTLVGTLIYNNIIYNMHQDAAIHLRGAEDIEIYNNTIYGYYSSPSVGYGIYVSSDRAVGNVNVKIKNNIVSTVGGDGFALNVSVKAYITECENNLWYNPGYTYAYVAGSSYHSDDQAAYRTATGWDDAPGGLWEDPLFVSATDFHLQSGSPCIDKGADLSGTVDDDYDGVSRPQGVAYDIGAYEYEGPSASLSPSISPSLSPSASQSPSESPSEGVSYSMSPSTSPSLSPSASMSPSTSPSTSPSISPSISPSGSPSSSPSLSPSASQSPSVSPSISPSLSPSVSPSVSLSMSPSVSPSISSSVSPSLSLSESPSISPSSSPSLSPSASQSPSQSPSVSPSISPSSSLSTSPSGSPSMSQSESASASPSLSPSQSSSISPSISPSASPSVADPPFVLVDSAYIVASGEDTTFQLTPPGIKDTGSFQAGRIQDDENPADPINLVSDKYTEIEWCIKATDETEVDATYEFRVTKVAFNKTSLISWWPLDEESGIRYDAHGTNHLTDNNTVGYAAGKVGNAADFEKDNSESLSIADNASLRMGAGVYFTLGTWLNIETLPGGAGYCGIIYKWPTPAEYFLGINGDHLEFIVHDGSNYKVLVSAVTLSLSTWYFVMAWYDGTNLNLQINNGSIETIAHNTDVYSGTSNFLLGGVSNETLDGLMDSPFVAKRIYTADERIWLYNSGAGRQYSDL